MELKSSQLFLKQLLPQLYTNKKGCSKEQPSLIKVLFFQYSYLVKSASFDGSNTLSSMSS
jgi:hypothetical protein